MGGYRFLTRPEEGGSLKYASLSAAFNDLSSDISALSARTGECSCEISAIVGYQPTEAGKQRTNVKIAQFKDCHNNTTDIYAPDSAMFQGNVGAKTTTIWSNSFAFLAGTSSNVQVICNGNNISIGCYYI